MLQHGILDGTDILGLDPVLGSLAEETLAVAALVLGLGGRCGGGFVFFGLDAVFVEHEEGWHGVKVFGW